MKIFISGPDTFFKFVDNGILRFAVYRTDGKSNSAITTIALTTAANKQVEPLPEKIS